MAKKPTIHTVPNPNGGWDVKKSGQPKPIAHADTKKEALQEGKKAAEKLKTEHVKHGKNGRIQDKDSYGNDPHPPKG